MSAHGEGQRLFMSPSARADGPTRGSAQDRAPTAGDLLDQFTKMRHLEGVGAPHSPLLQAPQFPAEQLAHPCPPFDRLWSPAVRNSSRRPSRTTLRSRAPSSRPPGSNSIEPNLDLRYGASRASAWPNRGYSGRCRCRCSGACTASLVRPAPALSPRLLDTRCQLRAQHASRPIPMNRANV